MRALLEEQNEEYARKELLESVWAAVLEGTEVTEYPKEAVQAGVDEFYDYYHKGAEIYGMEFGEFLENLGTTEELFEEQATAAAQENVKQDLIVTLICEKEKITITDEEYETAKTELAKEMSYASVEDMVDDVTEEKVRSYIMRDLVKEWLVDHCIQVKQ
jgi:trigger factor